MNPPLVHPTASLLDKLVSFHRQLIDLAFVLDRSGQPGAAESIVSLASHFDEMLVDTGAKLPRHGPAG